MLHEIEKDGFCRISRNREGSLARTQNKKTNPIRPFVFNKLQNESQFHRVRRLWGRLFNLRPIVNRPTARVDNGGFMKPTTTLAAAILLFFPMHSPAAAAGPYQYPFQNPDLPIEQRVDN